MHPIAFLMNEGPVATDLAFPYRVHRPQPHPTRAIVALHGSGVDETSILPLAAKVAPDALVIAPRGRILQSGERRWYEKITPTLFDQQSIREEAAAFAGFIEDLRDGGMLHPERTLFLGYSNGANLVAATMFLHPGLVQRAALLRSMPVVLDPPRPDLSRTRALVAAGRNDVTYGPYNPSLAAFLSDCGAEVESAVVDAGHEFGDEDVRCVRKWLDKDAEWSGLQASLSRKRS